jgi:hypothetical protein
MVMVEEDVVDMIEDVEVVEDVVVVLDDVVVGVMVVVEDVVVMEVEVVVVVVVEGSTIFNTYVLFSKMFETVTLFPECEIVNEFSKLAYSCKVLEPMLVKVTEDDPMLNITK